MTISECCKLHRLHALQPWYVVSGREWGSGCGWGRALAGVPTVRPCYVPSAVCVCVCDLCVREVSPLAVCLGRPTSLPPTCALSWLLELQRVHRHRHDDDPFIVLTETKFSPCLLGLAYFKRNCNDDVTQQICRDLRSAKRAACVSSDFLEFAGCRSAKRARTCVRGVI